MLQAELYLQAAICKQARPLLYTRFLPGLSVVCTEGCSTKSAVYKLVCSVLRHRAISILRACVSDDEDIVPEGSRGVCDEHHVLIPAQQLALAGRAADDHAVDPVLNLLLNCSIVCVDVYPAASSVRRFDGCDHLRLRPDVRGAYVTKELL